MLPRIPNPVCRLRWIITCAFALGSTSWAAELVAFSWLKHSGGMN